MTNASVRIMYNNLIATSFGTGTVQTSSYVSGFPPENIFSPYRWKEWVTSGAFEVITTNQVIYYDDGSGSASVNIPVTTSTPYSADSLAVAIAAALNTPSTNWTCTYSSVTGKFTIGRSSGTATLELTETTNAAWDMLGFTGAIDADMSTGTAADERRNHTSEHVVFDVTTALAAPKALLMTGQADVDFEWPTDARIRVRANSVNGTEAIWASAPLDVDIDVEKTGAYKFWESTEETGYRYWRVDFYDRTNPDGPEFGVNQMFLGQYFEPAEFNFNNGFGRTLVDPRSTVETDSLSRFHRARRKFWVYDGLDIANIQDSDRTELERIYSELGTTTPFWISLDPSASITASVGEFTKYVEFDGNMDSQHVLYKRFNHSLSVREVI